MAIPVIGFTAEFTSYDGVAAEVVERGLREPLEKAGGLALTLPIESPTAAVDHMLEILDGIQLCGGPDIDPVHYGQEQIAETKATTPDRDRFELALARGALERGIPILGICRGAQVLAVADGGSLTQDIPTAHPEALRHTWEWHRTLGPAGEHHHPVEIVEESEVSSWFGRTSLVNSFHHQAILDCGPRLTEVATAPDGIVEAVERADGEGWAVGLQWHNEMMWQQEERFLAPHRALVAAATAHADRRQRD